MSFLRFLDHWWNVPFLAMLVLVVLFAVLQLLGLLGHGADGGDAALDHHADLGGDAHADAHVDHDVHAGDHHVESGGFFAGALSLLGVGRAPVSLLVITLLLGTGLTGLIVNRAIYGLLGASYPGALFALAFLVAVVLGLVAVAVFARTAGKLVDTGGRPAPCKKDLTGRPGVVASPRLDDRFGEVRVRDADGNEMLVHGRLQKGEAPLGQGARVVLVDFDPETDMFWVAASPEVDAV